MPSLNTFFLTPYTSHLPWGRSTADGRVSPDEDTQETKSTAPMSAPENGSDRPNQPGTPISASSNITRSTPPKKPWWQAFKRCFHIGAESTFSWSSTSEENTGSRTSTSTSTSTILSINRDQVGWPRFIPLIGYHHVLMFLILVGIVLLAILLAGCTTEGMGHVYLLSLSYTNASIPNQDAVQTNPNASSAIANLAGNASRLEIRAGYFGFCIVDHSGGLVPSQICFNSATSLAEIVRGTNTDPLNLIWVAKQFHDGTIFRGLVFIGIILPLACLLLLATFPGWHTEEDSESSEAEIKPFPSLPVSYLALVCVTVAGLFSFISALWQHLSAAATVSMVKAFGYGFVRGHVGVAAMVLGWVAPTLYGVVVLGLLLMILHLRFLTSLDAD